VALWLGAVNGDGDEPTFEEDPMSNHESLPTTAIVTTLEAPLVLIDPCVGFAASLDEPQICAACGWLADDHGSEQESRKAA